MVKKTNKKSQREQQEENHESGFIREVNEDVQQDKMNQLVEKYGKKLAAICTIIILVVIANTVSTQIHKKNVLKEAGTFQEVVAKVDTLLLEKNFSEAEKITKDFISTAKYDYKDIAYTMLFEISLKTESVNKLEVLEEMAKNAETSKIKDFAIFNKAVIINNEKMNTETLVSNLKPILKNKKSTFNQNSKLIIVYSAIAEGKKEIADKFIKSLSEDNNISETLKNKLENISRKI